MNSKLVKSNKIGALLGALLLLAFIPNAGFAIINLTYLLDITNNWPGSVGFGFEQAQIKANARWGIYDNPVTNRNGDSVPLAEGTYYVDFTTMTNYYIPSAHQEIILTPDLVNTTLTYKYVPYSNTLSVTIAGTNGMTAPIVWSFSERPAEFVNSSAYSNKTIYTNNIFLTPIPTGQYTVTFPDVTGWATPPGPTTFTNITGASPANNYITGMYTRISGDLSCKLHPWPSISGDAYDALVLKVQTSGQWTLKQNDGTSVGTYTNLEWAYNIDTNYPPNPYRVSFNRVQDCYLPVTTNLTVTNAAMLITNWYYPYSNEFTILTIDQSGNPIDSPLWTITTYPPAEFTNSSAFINQGITGSGEETYTQVPTGKYVVSFGAYPGYSTPGAVTNTIAGTMAPTFTGTYTRILGNLQIIMTPDAAAASAPWAIINSPIFTNGTGNTTISNIPIGAYTVRFDDLIGFTTPPTSAGTLTTNETLKIYGYYTNWPKLTVVIYDASNPRDPVGSYNLWGVGTGTYTVAGASGPDTNGNWSFTPDAYVTLTAIPTNLVVGPNSYDSYFYKWYDIFNGARTVLSTEQSTTVKMEGRYDPYPQITYDRTIYLMFSREYNTFDNVGDLDGDGLPDVWEINNNLNPEDRLSTNGAAGNPDGDWIPNKFAIPPTRVSIDANGVSRYNSDASYPLSGGYAGTNILFNNLLECRGLDGYYKTSGPAGAVPDDDPYTSPSTFDTLENLTRSAGGMSDGWRYYFWYWRSANAYGVGITNSANLDWVRISPSMDRWINYSDRDEDTDGDGTDEYDQIFFSDEDEYNAGTDPTHCDTDGDGMDDYWEIQNFGASNALVSANALFNPDGDYYAVTTNIFVLRAGFQFGGTAFSTGSGSNVCYAGAPAAPMAAWWNNYTNTGPDVFDLYKDTILLANTPLTNRQTGTIYTNTVLYGTNAGLGAFQQGYPVWVDVDGDGIYGAGDIPVVNPPLKHELVYCMPPASPFPGVTSFDPRTAWAVTQTVDFATIHTNTQSYNNYQEYLGGDYFGRLSWNAGGQVVPPPNDDDLALTRNSYTDPNDPDTDGDTIEDGWELYVGLNPRDQYDAESDSDEDGLINREEWANVYRTYANTNATIGPTDPGFLVAPAPNDPHPRDTDWDGLGDALERANLSCPTAWDTDGDVMPDGWEIYAGTSVTTNDASADYDGDGLDNFEEYWTGTVDEWQYCDAAWGANFMTRKSMLWDAPKNADLYLRVFIPPDFLTDGSFMYYNGISANVDWLRANYPATKAIGDYKANYLEYHTTKANNPDSDGDGMDDFWEVYHGLNPCKGTFDMMQPAPTPPDLRWSYHSWYGIDYVDADPNTPRFDFGTRPESGGDVFHNLTAMVDHVFDAGTNRSDAIDDMVGPFNFGLYQMDADGDNLPNLDEYSYNPSRTLYHTDPTPIWRTDSRDTNSFVSLNYNWDSFANFLSPPHLYDPFVFEEKEGFDTDNDGVGDYAENNSAAGELGNNPLDERNPIRNRALYLNGTTDFARTLDSWVIFSESFLTKFCVEAWIKPDNPARAGGQVILEKAALYRNQYNPNVPVVGANFRLGITNGLPYVLYNGRGPLRTTYQATAQIYSLTPGVWAHIAGVYNGATLTLYVNGELSMSLGTKELPVTGVNAVETNYFHNAFGHSMMIGARDSMCGYAIVDHDYDVIACLPTNYFAGCIDEVRVWDGARTQAEVIANKNRRIPRSEMANSKLVHYYSFDDVPDPSHANSAGVPDEPVAPNGLTDLDTTMSFHPPITWWAAHPQRSTVYSGSNGTYNYLVSAADHAAHMSNSPPRDDLYHFSSNYLSTNVLSDYNNFSNPYEIQSFSVHGGYMRWYNPGIIEDMVLFKGARGVATNSWLSGLEDGNPDSTDTDGDGLPDWWEQLYGLDPNDATGDNGAWGDPDNDGLNNRAEYLIGKNNLPGELDPDPLNSNTAGTPVGDYDYHTGPYTRTWGEMYMDGDGMPDTWEMENNLDPQIYDAQLDKDEDGWSNYQEYTGNNDPNSAVNFPKPVISGALTYDAIYANIPLVIKGYHINDMDGYPQSASTFSAGAQVSVYETVGYIQGSRVVDGKLPSTPIPEGTPITIKISASSYSFIFTNTVAAGGSNYVYTGPWADHSAKLDYRSGLFSVYFPIENPHWGRAVVAYYSYTLSDWYQYQIGGFKEGDVYLEAFKDVNGSGQYDIGEPYGVGESQPVMLNAASPIGPRITLEESINGYPRFSWSVANVGSSTTGVGIVINKISQSGAPQVLNRIVHVPRNYFTEWDYQQEGFYGLTAGTYQWWAQAPSGGAQNGTFSVTWPAGLSKPVLDYPRGAELIYARNDFKWTMDRKTTRVHLQVARQEMSGVLAMVMDDYYPVACRNSVYGRPDLAQYTLRLPKYASELGNGVYYWRVAGWNPQSESAWSDVSTFEVNLSTDSSRWIIGNLYYYGKVPATNIIVEAYDNQAFSGWPLAKMKLPPPATTPSWTTNGYGTNFNLQGLEPGTYYVRAYIDTPANNSMAHDGKLDSWKSWGFVKNPAGSDYRPRQIPLIDTFFVDNAIIVIRDRDTDNDELPDAWEMIYFGNLDQTGDMDYDDDGETNLQEYIKDGVNQNPACWDTDGDGLADGFEAHYDGAAFGFAMCANSVGTALNPNVRDTDGDGFSDGAELRRYHTDPLNPASYPRYTLARPLYTDAWGSPGDFDGDGKSDLALYRDGYWSIYSMAGRVLLNNVGVWGGPDFIPVPGDYDGDGNSDLALYHNGYWSVYSFANGIILNNAGVWGGPDFIPVPGDYDGDGKSDLAVYRDGNWSIYSVARGIVLNNVGVWGGPGWIPVPGDYNNDGANDFAVYEPATGQWFIKCLHKYDGILTVLGGGLGGPTWMPVPGDIDGDGRSDICVFEESTGSWMLYTLAGWFGQGGFGGPGCVPVPGDYDGDGRTDLVVYDKNTGVWSIFCWGAYYAGGFGGPGWLPILQGRF